MAAANYRRSVVYGTRPQSSFGRASLVGIGLALLLGTSSEAQYTADFQTNIISSVTSNWVGNYYVGNTNFADVLLIQNSGVLSNGLGYVGYEVGSSNNSVLVTGTGAVWRCNRDLSIGFRGAGNSLLISNGGRVVGGVLGEGHVGDVTSSRNNSVLVTGTGSVWSNFYFVIVGSQGSSNRLVISDGGVVIDTHGIVGQGGVATYSLSVGSAALVTGTGSVWASTSTMTIGSAFCGIASSLVISNGGQVIDASGVVGDYLCCSNNTVLVTDGGIWQNNILYTGNQGSSNSLVIDGGSVIATNSVVGFASKLCNNLVQLDSGDLTVTNATGDATFEVRQGKLIVNGGTLQVDQFVMTNACAQFIRTGGTLIYGTAVLTTNLDADGDGMANGWEQASGLDPLNAADASADNDGDGFTNLQEFQAGTDPTNASSGFRVLSLESTNNDILVTWLTGGGRTNVVQSAPDLTGSYSNVSPNIILTNVTGDVTTNYLDDGAATNAPVQFYRIRLVP